MNLLYFTYFYFKSYKYFFNIGNNSHLNNNTRRSKKKYFCRILQRFKNRRRYGRASFFTPSRVQPFKKLSQRSCYRVYKEKYRYIFPRCGIGNFYHKIRNHSLCVLKPAVWNSYTNYSFLFVKSIRNGYIINRYFHMYLNFVLMY